jgi:hypothetical protein
MKVPSQGNRASIKKVVPYYRYVRTFKVLKPKGRKRIEKGLDRIQKVRLYIPERPKKGARVKADLGANSNVRKGEVLGTDGGSVKDEGAKGRGEVLRVVVQPFNHWNIRQKVLVTTFRLGAPDVVLVVVDNAVQVRVAVLDSGADGDGEEVGILGAEVVVASFNW